VQRPTFGRRRASSRADRGEGTELKRWTPPSLAMVVALAALAFSVGGNVTAAVLITSADIKDNTIRSADLRDETIRSVDDKSGSLTGVDVANNSLTGAGLNESTPARVPAAASAINAQNAANASLLGGQPASADVADTDGAGGDMTGTFSNMQIRPDTIGRTELGIDHNSLGCCVGSFLEFTVSANTCHTRASSFPRHTWGRSSFRTPRAPTSALAST
jgi:hypothetical protein